MTPTTATAGPAPGGSSVPQHGAAEVSACGQLQPLADCIHAAIAELQREPAPGRLATFVDEAGRAGVTACRDVATTESWTRSESSMDHFDDGSARMYVGYRFTHDACAPVELEVVVTLGEPGE